MDDQNKNLILATLLSFVVIMAWTVLFPPEDLPIDPATEAVVSAEDPTLPAADPATPAATTPTDAPEHASEAPRIAIETGEFQGSLSLRGGRIDDLALTLLRRLAPDVQRLGCTRKSCKLTASTISLPT